VTLLLSWSWRIIILVTS